MCFKLCSITGQTDIKRLRKENEQLRREIWTLRDECDRLNKRVKAKFIEHEQGVYSARCSVGNGCTCQCNDGIGCDLVHSRCNSEVKRLFKNYCFLMLLFLMFSLFKGLRFM